MAKRVIVSVPLLCQAWFLPEPTPEFRFHPTRKWQFDWAWVAKKTALEIEGGAWIGGRHTSGAGFLKDMEKYNAAVLLGWKVLRCTPRDVASGAIGELLKQALI